MPVAEIGGPVLQVDDVLADHHESEQPAAAPGPVIEVLPTPAEPVAAEPPAPAVIVVEPPAAPAEATTPEPPAAPEPPRQGIAEVPRPRPQPVETVFPIARPPDDPGPEQPAPVRRASFLGN